MGGQSARQLAYRSLCRIFADGSYSNLTLGALLRGQSDPRERALASRLCYGVLERKLTIDPQILRYCRRRPAAEVLIALELGFYQLLYLDHLPPSAVVNETVNLVKSSRQKAAAGFVNGVLRSFLRDGCQVQLPQKGRLARLEVETGMPQWILRLWEQDYGFETAAALSKAALGRPPVCLRVNTCKTDTRSVAETLRAGGISVQPHPLLPDCLLIEQQGDLGAEAGYQSGDYYVQDSASQLCAAALGAVPGERVFDLCAAPGGKSFTAAMWMENRGEIRSFDLHPQRVQLIADGARRLGLSAVHAAVGDAAVFRPSLGTADCVLCDVPCSGLGVVRRKPEIRYKSPDALAALQPLQREILENAARYVRPGGRLVYSTCALSKRENEENAAWFLQEHPEFRADPLPALFQNIPGTAGHQVTLMPHWGDFDGFYIARFRRIEAEKPASSFHKGYLLR